MKRVHFIVYAIVLAVGTGANAYILFFATDQFLRLGLGLILLAPLLWAAARVGVYAHTHKEMVRQLPRRYRLLRSRVGQMLDEIRRMNWTAVDMDRGVRDPGEALKELDAIEQGLLKAIPKIRQAAGTVTSEGPELPPEEDDQPES